MTYTEKFKQLAKLYATTEIEFPHLKPVTVAQWMLESGRGWSFLAKDHNNFGGMMWKPEMDDVWAWPGISKVKYTSPSDNIDTNYVSCSSLAIWIRTYWKFIDRKVYSGWREHADTASDYIRYLKLKGYAADPEYVDKVLALLPEAKELLTNLKDNTHSEGESMKQPKIDATKSSPNKSTRSGTVQFVVVHNTAGSYNGAVSWLCNPAAKASAHLVISRTGHVTQLVPFTETAWHAGNGRVNHTSIGIEIEATNNQRGMTDIQEKVLIEWIEYFMYLYKIKADKVITHRSVNPSTDCPVLIWPKESDFAVWRKKNLEGEAPKPQPQEPTVTWFELHRFQDGIGCVGYDGSEPKVTYRGKSSKALVDFLQRWGDHNILVAPETKPWPGNTR